MRFPFRKKKKREQEEAVAPPAALPDLSLFVCGAPDLLPADLPENCETVYYRALSPDTETTSPAAPQDPSSAQKSLPRGRYIVFVSGEDLFADPASLLCELEGHEEELLLFRANEKAELPDADKLRHDTLRAGEIGFAASRSLFEKLPPALYGAGRCERLAAFLMLADSCAALKLCARPRERIEDTETAARSLISFIRFFGDVRAKLTEERYRFAFSYACERTIGTYAELAAEDKIQSLQKLDEFLKTENMALRVAAKERSSLLRRLIQKNFRVPFWLRPLCALAANRDREKR